MYHVIYKITNTINGKIYIGKHTTRDLDDNYLGSGKAIMRAIVKYGSDAFTKEILHTFQTPEEAFQKESEIVDQEFVSRADTYNLKVGGFGGWPKMKMTREHRDKLSAARRGKKRSPEACANISNGRKGVTSEKIKASCARVKELNKSEVWKHYDEIFAIWKDCPMCYPSFHKKLVGLGYDLTKKVSHNMVMTFKRESGISPNNKITPSQTKLRALELIPMYYPISAPSMHKILKEKDIDISINVLRTMLKSHRVNLDIA